MSMVAVVLAVVLGVALVGAPRAHAQDPAGAGGVAPPPGYVIGAGDQLRVVFWGEQNMSAEVAVRPDGMISLPLLNDVTASGLTPDELRVRVAERAAPFVDVPVTVVVVQINSRNVFITGEISSPGPYPINQPTSVMQLIAQAGGLLEWADEDSIVILRNDALGNPIAIQFNYNDVVRRRNLRQNIQLQPGDTVVVP
jgi:polysaccharide export outer membrane protein